MESWCIAAITCCEIAITKKQNPPRRHGDAEKSKALRFRPPLPPFLCVSKGVGFCLLNDPMIRFPDLLCVLRVLCGKNVLVHSCQQTMQPGCSTSWNRRERRSAQLTEREIARVLSAADRIQFGKDAQSLIRFHDLLLFFRAFPSGPNVLRLAERLLKSF